MQPFSILVVDDEFIIRDWLGMMLQRRYGDKVSVEKASSGEEALEILNQRTIDILITDIRMKRMSGLDLIGQIRGLCPQTKCVLISNHNDFSYAAEAIRLGASNYLLKSEIGEEDLYGVVDAVMDEILMSRQKGNVSPDELALRGLLRKLLDGGAAEAGEARLLEQAVGSHNGWVMVVFEFDCGKPTPKRMEAAVDYVQRHVRLWFSGGPCVRRQGQVVAMLPGRATSLKSVRERLEIFCMRCIAEMSETALLSAGISPTFHKLNEALAAYRQAVQALERRFFTDGGIVKFLVDARSAGDTHIVDQLYQRRAAVRNALSLRQYNQAIALVDELLEQPEALAALGRSEAISYLAQLYGLFADHALQDDPAVGWKLSAAFERELGGFNLFNGVATHLRASLQSLVSHNRAAASGYDLVEAAQAYVRENYPSDISLAAVAAAIHVSESYLSRSFRQKTGQTFSSFLQQTRIEAAKTLLLSGDIPITQVCTWVGFSSLSYFAQAFRRSEGTSPRQWRADALQKEQKN